MPNPGQLGAVAVGLLTGVVIGRATEYATSASPTGLPGGIAAAAESGLATIIIVGIARHVVHRGTGETAVAAGTMFALLFSAGLIRPGPQGLYGVAIAAVGMLSTLWHNPASDAYGPSPTMPAAMPK